jgi:hypothetical protein
MPHTALSPGPYGPDLGPPGYGWNLAASSDSGAEKQIGHGEPHPERPVHGHIRSAARHHDIHPEISRRRRLVPGRLRRRDPSPLAHRERQLAVRRCPAPRSKYGSATVPTCPSSSIIAPTDARGRCRRCPRHRQARGCGKALPGVGNAYLCWPDCGVSTGTPRTRTPAPSSREQERATPAPGSQAGGRAGHARDYDHRPILVPSWRRTVASACSGGWLWLQFSGAGSPLIVVRRMGSRPPTCGPHAVDKVVGCCP